MENDFFIYLTGLFIVLVLVLFPLDFSIIAAPSSTPVQEVAETTPAVQEQLSMGCFDNGVLGAIIGGDENAIFEGNNIQIPDLAFDLEIEEDTAVLGVNTQNRWIEVDLSEQRLTAWEGDSKFLETLVSTGLPWYPTPTGEFRIWIKLRATKMEGGSGDLYYYLPNVPYVMYFENDQVPGWRGYGLHGTYWHSDFGTQRSHGCVNLPTEIAAQLYDWVTPNLIDNQWGVRSSAENPGTRIVIHE